MTLTRAIELPQRARRPVPLAPLRVVYAAAGTLPAACVLRDSKAVIDHKLYWTTAASAGEARYLAAILNSETARERTAKYQSRGQWGARDFDKVVFNLPIPRYDSKIKLHRDLAAAAAKAERVAAAVALPEGVKFQRARSLVRAALRKRASPTRSTRWSRSCSTAHVTRPASPPHHPVGRPARRDDLGLGRRG